MVFSPPEQSWLIILVSALLVRASSLESLKQRDPGENQIDYGAVDGKDVVAADERFVSVFEKLSKALKVKKHGVWDKTGKRHELEGSIETKGLLGTDGRKYVLDLYRITPLDICWMEVVGTAINSPEKANGRQRKSVTPIG